MEETKNKVEKETLYSRLNIPKERADFLGKQCKQVFNHSMENPDIKKDVIDMMWEIRNSYTENAAEDMYVCYVIGAMQGAYIATIRLNNPLKTLIDFLK